MNSTKYTNQRFYLFSVARNLCDTHNDYGWNNFTISIILIVTVVYLKRVCDFKMSLRNFFTSYFLIIFRILLAGVAFCIGTMLSISYMQMTSCEVPSPLALIRPSKEEHFLVVLILTAPTNFVKRQAIRQTWINLNTFTPSRVDDYFYKEMFIPKYRDDGTLILEAASDQYRLADDFRVWNKFAARQDETQPSVAPQTKIKYYFTIGTQGMTEKERVGMMGEKFLHKDVILLDDHVDIYNNLTLKLLASIKEISRRVNFKYLLHCHDDTYVKLDVLVRDLINYDRALHISYANIKPMPELYWGYFYGKSHVVKQGLRNESHYLYGDRYVTYALGAGYVISYGLVKYINDHAKNLNALIREDCSVALWLVPFGNIHYRHDVRFDTGIQPRKCEEYHLVLGKRTPREMIQMYEDDKDICVEWYLRRFGRRSIYAYAYDWSKPPSRCCERTVYPEDEG